MAIDRVKVALSGFPGQPGTMNLYFASATPTNLAAIRTLLLVAAANTPNTLTWTIPGTGDTINEIDGKIVSGWTATPPAAVTGTNAGVYAAATGAVLEWRVAGVVDGRRPIGKTFLVPLVTSSFDAVGTLNDALRTSLAAAAQAFVAATSGFVIWHRPVFSKTTPPVLIRSGSSVQVAQGTCPDFAAVLKSRR